MAAGMITKREPTLEEEIALEEQENEEEETELEEDEDEPGIPTDIICMECMDNVSHGSDVVLIQLVIPYVQDNTVRYMVILDDLGEPLLEPIFFHYECFENNAEALAESLEDVPPIEEPGTVLECDYCKFSIRIGETSLTAEIGEVLFSQRLTTTTTFVPSDPDSHPYVLCLSCGNTLFDVAELQGHEEVLTQNGECSDCTTARCWRAGRCLCRCHC